MEGNGQGSETTFRPTSPVKAVEVPAEGGAPDEAQKYEIFEPEEAASVQVPVELPPVRRQQARMHLSRVRVVLDPRDRKLASWFESRGFREARLLVGALRAGGVKPQVAAALVTMETGNFKNIYGHDPVRNRAPKGGLITEHNWKNLYLPDRRDGRGMQGAGPVQLTWHTYQTRADRLGGCWKPYYSALVGFSIFRGYTRDGASPWQAAKQYNGSADYANSFVSWMNVWERRLRRAGFKV